VDSAKRGFTPPEPTREDVAGVKSSAVPDPRLQELNVTFLTQDIGIPKWPVPNVPHGSRTVLLHHGIGNLLHPSLDVQTLGHFHQTHQLVIPRAVTVQNAGELIHVR